VRKLIFVIVALLPLVANAKFPPIYNAVRCRMADHPSTAVHVAIFKSQPMGMYWIENDRVTVLSNEVEEDEGIVTAKAFAEQGAFRLDFNQGDFLTFNHEGALVREEHGLNCVRCPIELDYCPGDEPGYGTNVPPPIRK
jgi:hypothetical protein